MKIGLALVVLTLFALSARATEIDYSFSVVNSPGGIGDLSWEIQTAGFIQPQGPVLDDPVTKICMNCDTNFFTSFVSVSEPSNGGGCRISKLYLVPEYELVTMFEPVCAGGGDGLYAGVLPDPGVFGTWNWQDANPDGTSSYTSLTISDPPGDPVTTPEPAAFWLLACGMGLLYAARKIKF